MPDGSGSGWAGITGIKDITLIDADGADRGRGRQGAARAEAEGARAGPLHRHPRAARQRAVPVADDRHLQRAARRRARSATTSAAKQPGTTKIGDKLFSDLFTLKSDIGNPILRQTPILARQHGREAGDVGREGRAQEPRLRPRWAKRQKQDPTPANVNMSLVHGRLGPVDRGHDQADAARPARDVLLVHPRRRSRRRCSTPA